jgi:hypothetical protein
MTHDIRTPASVRKGIPLLRTMVILLLIALAMLSPMNAQRDALVDDITAQMKLIVTPTTLTFTIDLENTSDTTYIIIPYMCRLFRLTPCRTFYRVGASTGFFVPWRLQRAVIPTDKCASKLVPSLNPEPFPITRLSAALSPQLVAIRPGQKARFIWTEPYVEDPSYLDGSTCMIDTTYLPVRLINEDMRQLFGDGLIEQATPFREYIMDEVDTKVKNLFQFVIRGESRVTSFLIPYEQYDKKDRALFLSQRYIRVPPGPNTSCIVLEK